MDHQHAASALLVNAPQLLVDAPSRRRNVQAVQVEARVARVLGVAQLAQHRAVDAGRDALDPLAQAVDLEGHALHRGVHAAPAPAQRRRLRAQLVAAVDGRGVGHGVSELRSV